MRAHLPVRFALVTASVLSIGVGGAEARAQGAGTYPRGPFREAVERLIRYEEPEVALAALGELGPIGRGLDSRQAAAARFLRAAAAIDLLVLAQLGGAEGTSRRRVAEALELRPEELEAGLGRALEEASVGALASETRGYRVVLRCLDRAAEPSCARALRRIVAEDRTGASAARLLLLEQLALATERSRAGHPELLGQIAAGLCRRAGEAGDGRCVEALGAQDLRHRQVTQLQMILRHVVNELAEVERLAALGDPLGQAAGSWARELGPRLGWVVVPQSLPGDAFQAVGLPSARSAPALPPLALLVVGRSTVSVAVAPSMVEVVGQPISLDERSGFALPGRVVLRLPARFRPVVRPIDEVAEALGDLRQAMGQVISSLEGEGPPWMEGEERSLGLLVDGGINLVDLARYVASARRAGFERFVLLGRREDGQLGAVPAIFGSMEDGPPQGALPCLRIAPREARFVPPAGLPIESSTDELERLGRSAVDYLAPGSPAFVAQGRPMMPYRMVLPSIDAVAAAAPNRRPAVLFLVPP